MNQTEKTNQIDQLLNQIEKKESSKTKKRLGIGLGILGVFLIAVFVYFIIPKHKTDLADKVSYEENESAALAANMVDDLATPSTDNVATSTEEEEMKAEVAIAAEEEEEEEDVPASTPTPEETQPIAEEIPSIDLSNLTDSPTDNQTQADEFTPKSGIPSDEIESVDLTARLPLAESAYKSMERKTPQGARSREPFFPGGKSILRQYLSSRVKYPAAAAEAGVEGEVRVKVTIAEDGSISGAQVLSGIGYGCEDEVLKVIALMPNWEPGLENGQAVKKDYQLTVNFTPPQ